MIYDKVHFEKEFIKKIVIGNNMLVIITNGSEISAKFLVPWPEFQY